MRPRRIHYLLLFLLPFLLLSMLIGGCTGTPTDAASDPPRRPGVGSWYAYSRVETDSTLAGTTGIESLDTLTVISTGNSFRGKSDLHMLESSRDESYPIRVYLGYQSNDDVMSIIGDTCSCWENWIPFTIGTKQTTTLPKKDTTLFQQTYNSAHHLITEVVRYDSTVSVTVLAGTFDTHRLTLLRTQTVKLRDRILTVASTTAYYFDTSIGYLVKVVTRIESTLDTLPGSLRATESEQVLTAYELK
jgi:hypothetical protein